MIAAHIINTKIPTLDLVDDAQQALILMKKHRCNCLPVVRDKRLVGFVSQESLVGTKNAHKKISQYDLTGATCVAHLECHFHDILKIANQHRLKMVAILDEDKHYRGVVTVQDITAPFSQVDNLLMKGGIIVLSLDMLNYSLSAISRLVEENGAKILCSFIAEDGMDAKKIKLILQINRPNLTHIIATLERFGYKIIGHYQSHPRVHDKDAERIDMLMHYLTI